MGVTKMIRERVNTDLAKWIICILAALAFGAYLGSPASKVWAQPVSGMVSTLSEQIAKMESLHSKPAEKDDTTTSKEKADAGQFAGSETAMKVSALESQDSEVPTGEATGEALGFESPEAGGQVELIVSEPPVYETPDYVLQNANRGGVADRKEKDILIHLINAEAYGLSYKAKLAVGQVVMNRWTGPYYGDSLMAIMTAPHQFTPIHDGSAYKKEIEADSIQAANAVLSGVGVKELTDDTYYFVNPDFTQDKTIERKMEFVCEIEGLHFYKPPVK